MSAEHKPHSELAEDFEIVRQWVFQNAKGGLVAGAALDRIEAQLALREPDYSVFHEWCVENMPKAVELCPYKFPKSGLLEQLEAERAAKSGLETALEQALEREETALASQDYWRYANLKEQLQAAQASAGGGDAHDRTCEQTGHHVITGEEWCTSPDPIALPRETSSQERDPASERQ